MAKRTLDIVHHHTPHSCKDLKYVGKPDVWKIICKSWSYDENWMVVTKAMIIPGGIVLSIMRREESDQGHASVTDAMIELKGKTLEPVGDGTYEIAELGTQTKQKPKSKPKK